MFQILTEEEKLRAMAVHTQELAWYDLNEAMNHALNGTWSIGCTHQVWRIVPLARLVGPTEPGNVQWQILASGLYYAILTRADIEHEEVDLYSDYYQIMHKYGAPSQMKVKYASAVQAMHDSWPTDEEFIDYLGKN